MGKDTAVSEYFELYNRERVNSLTSCRKGEKKLGECVAAATDSNESIHEVLKNSSAQFVLLGIPEDIGVRANGGVGGTHTLWEPALKALLNIQSTDSLKGDNLLVLGAFNFEAWMKGTLESDMTVLRNFVGWIDDAVYPLIEMIVLAGKIPVVIGGGHNNALPLLKGTARALGRPVHCINLDAHSDYRMMEGRHSGNGFRYARLEGCLDKYAMVGLHRNYNSQLILNEITADPGLHISFYDDILLQETLSFREAVFDAIKHTNGNMTGIELDMDCIEGTLSSAATRSGIHTLEARQYLQWCGKHAQPAYLHLAEGAVRLRDGRHDTGTAKLAAYLISDFMRNLK